MRIAHGSLVLSLVAIVAGIAAVAYEQRDALHAQAEYQTTLLRLAAQAQPVHAVRTEIGVRYKCVSATGWEASAPTPDEAAEICNETVARRTDESSPGFPRVDVAALQEAICDGPRAGDAGGLCQGRDDWHKAAPAAQRQPTWR